MRYSDATAEQLNSLMYATVDDVRAEGVGDDVSSDRITKAINQASVRISALTGTVFKTYPCSHNSCLRVDGDSFLCSNCCRTGRIGTGKKDRQRNYRRA